MREPSLVRLSLMLASACSTRAGTVQVPNLNIGANVHLAIQDGDAEWKLIGRRQTVEVSNSHYSVAQWCHVGFITKVQIDVIDAHDGSTARPLDCPHGVKFDKIIGTVRGLSSGYSVLISSQAAIRPVHKNGEVLIDDRVGVSDIVAVFGHGDFLSPSWRSVGISIIRNVSVPGVVVIDAEKATPLEDRQIKSTGLLPNEVLGTSSSIVTSNGTNAVVSPLRIGTTARVPPAGLLSDGDVHQLNIVAHAGGSDRNHQRWGELRNGAYVFPPFLAGLTNRRSGTKPAFGWSPYPNATRYMIRVDQKTSFDAGIQERLIQWRVNVSASVFDDDSTYLGYVLPDLSALPGWDHGMAISVSRAYSWSLSVAGLVAGDCDAKRSCEKLVERFVARFSYEWDPR